MQKYDIYIKKSPSATLKGKETEQNWTNPKVLHCYSSLTRLNFVEISFWSMTCSRLKRFFCAT